MNELLELLGLVDTIAEMDPTALATYESDLRRVAAEIDLSTATDDDVENLLAAADAAEAARTRMNELAASTADREERAAAALARIAGEDEGDDVAELAGLEGLSEDEIVALSALAAPDPEGEPEVVPELAGLEGLSAEDITALHGLTASAAPPARASRVAARRPAAFAARPQTPVAAPGSFESWGLTASANTGSSFTPGARLDTEDKLAEAFLAAWDANRGYSGNRQNIKVATAKAEYPAHLQVNMSDPGGMTQKIEELQRNIRNAPLGQAKVVEGLVASGGPCAPSEVRYDLPILGVDARPVRDGMLTRVDARRGGLRTLPPPRITDLTGAIGVWNDETGRSQPGNLTAKPCLTVSCPDDDETIVEAVTKCLEYGNFRARYFPEQVAAWMELASVAHARVAETRLLTQIAADSTNTQVGQVLGSARSFLAGLSRAAAGYRSRHRLPRTFRLEIGMPEWLIENFRTDLARELPGSADERLAVAEAEINTWFAVRNITPHWFLDGESGQIFGTQNPGAINGWPSTVVTYMYPAGSWLFLDGGSLDLGIVRDSTLNGTNDVQVFSETMEAAHFHGVESLRIVFDICPDGSTSATEAIDPCTVGS